MSNIMGNAKLALINYNKEKTNTSNIITEIINNIIENKSVILNANNMDVSEENGFKLDFNIIKDLLNKMRSEKSLYKTKLLSLDKNQAIECDNLGVLETFFDGNTYIFVEVALKSIISHNSMIFISQKDYMKYTNAVILEIVKKTLESKKIDKNIIQLIYDYDILKYCTNSYVIKKAFVIGNTDLHNTIKRISKLETEYIGYNDCDIYIEDIDSLNILKEFIDNNNNILFKTYIKESLDISLEDAIYVENVEKCMEEIGFDSCNYCNILFSKDKRTKIDFSELSKAKYIVINKLMDFNKNINIDINRFYCKKNIII